VVDFSLMAGPRLGVASRSAHHASIDAHSHTGRPATLCVVTGRMDRARQDRTSSSLTCSRCAMSCWETGSFMHLQHS